MSSTMDSAADKRDQIQSRVENSLRRRHAKEKRFKMFGLAAVLIGLAFVAVLFETLPIVMIGDCR